MVRSMQCLIRQLYTRKATCAVWIALACTRLSAGGQQCATRCLKACKEPVAMHSACGARQSGTETVTHPCITSIFLLQVAAAFEPASSEHSDHTNAKLSPANSGSSSAPSSPSCASACAATAAGAPGAVFGFCEPVVLATESGAAPSSLQAQDAPPATCSDSPAAVVAAADVSVLAHVAAEAAAHTPAAAAAAGIVSAAAVAAAAMHAESFGFTAEGADSSAQAAADQAAAEAAAAAEEAAAAAAALATSSLSGALAMPGLAALQRPPRIKSKPSNSMVKVAAILESKKRPAARLAMNPSSGHCCTQCGAVVSTSAQTAQPCPMPAATVFGGFVLVCTCVFCAAAAQVRRMSES